MLSIALAALVLYSLGSLLAVALVIMVLREKSEGVVAWAQIARDGSRWIEGDASKTLEIPAPELM